MKLTHRQIAEVTQKLTNSYRRKLLCMLLEGDFQPGDTLKMVGAVKFLSGGGEDAPVIIHIHGEDD